MAAHRREINQVLAWIQSIPFTQLVLSTHIQFLFGAYVLTIFFYGRRWWLQPIWSGARPGVHVNYKVLIQASGVYNLFWLVSVLSNFSLVYSAIPKVQMRRRAHGGWHMHDEKPNLGSAPHGAWRLLVLSISRCTTGYFIPSTSVHRELRLRLHPLLLWCMSSRQGRGMYIAATALRARILDEEINWGTSLPPFIITWYLLRPIALIALEP